MLKHLGAQLCNRLRRFQISEHQSSSFVIHRGDYGYSQSHGNNVQLATGLLCEYFCGCFVLVMVKSLRIPVDIINVGRNSRCYDCFVDYATVKGKKNNPFKSVLLQDKCTMA